MNLQSILGVSLAGAALIVSVGFVMHRPHMDETKPDIPAAPASYMEPMPEASDESYRVHVLDAEGVETEIRVKYKDGSGGILIPDAAGKTVQETRFYLDGTVRKQAVFDSEGVLVSGFEYRDDRSLLWSTTLSADQSKTVTNVYWPGGQLFLERVYVRLTALTQSTFYRENGVRWQDMEYTGTLINWHKTFDEEGKLVVLQKRVVETGGQFAQSEMYARHNQYQAFVQVVYFDDGKPVFEQSFGYSALKYYDPTSGKPNLNSLIVKSVGLYESGKLTSQVYLSGDQRVRMVDLIAPDGSIERRYVQTNGQITRIDTITASSSSTRYDFQGAFGKATPIDSRYLVPLPDNDVPYRQFNANEARLHEDAE